MAKVWLTSKRGGGTWEVDEEKAREYLSFYKDEYVLATAPEMAQVDEKTVEPAAPEMAQVDEKTKRRK